MNLKIALAQSCKIVIENYKKNYKIYHVIFGLVLLFLSIFVAKEYLKLLFKITNNDLLSLIPAIERSIILVFVTLTVFIISISAIKEVRVWIQNNSAIISTILVLGTVLISFTVYLIGQTETLWQTNSALVATDELNYLYANKFLVDSKNQWVYWTYYLTSPYEQSLPFITQNFDQNCLKNYMLVMSNMEVLNELNKSFNEKFGGVFLSTSSPEILIAINWKNQITAGASSTSSSIKELLAQCHGINVQ